MDEDALAGVRHALHDAVGVALAQEVGADQPAGPTHHAADEHDPVHARQRAVVRAHALLHAFHLLVDLRRDREDGPRPVGHLDDVLDVLLFPDFPRLLVDVQVRHLLGLLAGLDLHVEPAPALRLLHAQPVKPGHQAKAAAPLLGVRRGGGLLHASGGHHDVARLAVAQEPQLQKLRLPEEHQLLLLGHAVHQLGDREQGRAHVVVGLLLVAAVLVWVGVEDVEDDHHGLVFPVGLPVELLVPGRVQRVAESAGAADLAHCAGHHHQADRAVRVALTDGVGVLQIPGLHNVDAQVHEALEAHHAQRQRVVGRQRLLRQLPLHGDLDAEQRLHALLAVLLGLRAGQLELPLNPAVLLDHGEVEVRAAEEVVAAHEARQAVVRVVEEELQPHELDEAPVVGAAELEALVPLGAEGVVDDLGAEHVDQVVVGPNALHHTVRV
mmetsp:Transcript_84579/g.217926  ORF Transcript_84579/g.217926 Transcript_84579/m.217926 type:complete len:439 (-) Transcript_84579:398-1714(-)